MIGGAGLSARRIPSTSKNPVVNPLERNLFEQGQRPDKPVPWRRFRRPGRQNKQVGRSIEVAPQNGYRSVLSSHSHHMGSR